MVFLISVLLLFQACRDSAWMPAFSKRGVLTVSFLLQSNIFPKEKKVSDKKIVMPNRNGSVFGFAVTIDAHKSFFRI